MKYYRLALLFFIVMINHIALASYSEKSDPIKSELEQEVDSLCKVYDKFLHTDPEKAFEISQRSLRLADSIGYTFGSVSSKHNLSTYYCSIGDYKLSLENSFNALHDLRFLLAENNFGEYPKIYDQRLAQIYGSIASACSYFEYHSLAIKYLNKAEDIFKQQDDSRRAIAKIYANKSSLYRRNAEIEIAKEMLSKSLKTFKELKETRVVGLCYANMANIYGSTKNYDTMLVYMDSSIAIHTDLKKYDYLANCYNNKATCYFNQEEYQTTLDNLDIASVFLEKMENKKYLSDNNSLRGETYLKQGKLDLAEEILLPELENSASLMYHKNASVICEVLITLYEKKKEPWNVLKYKSLLLDFKNTLEEHQDKKAILEEKYALQFDQQADLFDFRKTLQAKSSTIISIIFAFIIAQILVLVFMYNHKRKLI